MKRPYAILATIVFLFGCTQQYSQHFTYYPPEYLGDGIAVGTLEKVGIDKDLIGEAVERIRRGKYGEIHSLLIYKDGDLVLEEYFPGHRYQWDAPRHYGEWIEWDTHTPHQIHSVTKSVTSTLIGIAIDKGFIESVDQSIFDFLPDHQHLNNHNREYITIEHLLTMSSGLAHVEWSAAYSSPENPVIGIWYSDKDPVSFILDVPLIKEPGSQFTYYGGSQVLLGEILRHASGMNVDEFSRRYLFDPLEIDTAYWNVQYPNGVFEAAGCLYLTPRSMLKIGAMYLDKGHWEQKEIVSEDWVEACSSNYQDYFNIDIPGTDGRNMGYGYSWWLPSFVVEKQPVSAFSANGFGGQKIVVLPSLGSVIVMNGGNYTSKTHQFEIIERYLIPAMRKI